MSKSKLTLEEESEVAIELFNILIEQEQAHKDSQNLNFSQIEKDLLFKKSEKLKKEFERLANKADGISEVRTSTKGAAYSLAQYYLNEYPTGSLTVTRTVVPSLFKFSKELETKIIETQSGPLEIERVNGKTSIEMAINGNCTEKYTLSMLKTGFKRAKREIKK
jgi:hypothetical protein